MTPAAVRRRENVLPAKALLLPSSFMLASSRGRLVVPKHIIILERFILEAIVRGDELLTIEAPVRCGKSVFVDWKLPSWYLGRFPGKHVGLASHEAQFASSWSAKARDDLVEFGSSFGVEVSRDIRSRSWWEIEDHGGSMRSFGIKGGGITGRGFDLFLMDDLIKNAADADSQVIREAQWDFLLGTAMPRLEPGAVAIVMMARWHEDDLIGRIHREMPGKWKRLRMPALAEAPSAEFPDPDPMGRKPGEALWPQRFSVANLARRRSLTNEYYFNANYQQRPSSPTGTIFKRDDWGRWYELPPRFDSMLWSFDMSFKGKEDSDYVVGQVWGRLGADFYLAHQVRGQWDFPEAKEIIRRETQDPKWAPAASTILIEDSANGPAIIADLKHEISGLIPVPAGRDSKTARARSISGYVEAGNVHIPNSAPWVDAFLHETAAFPKGANDDCVDALSQALRRMVDSGSASIATWTGSDLPPRG